MKPFLLLATRAEGAAADAEYEAFLRLGGLAERDLQRVRLESAPMPSVDLDQVSGIILGGSPYDTTAPAHRRTATQDRVEAELAVLLDEVLARDFPFLGACYGIGTRGRQLGAAIDGTYAEPVGPTTIVLTPEGRGDPLLAGIPDTFEAYVGHKEACSRLPESAVLLASSATCPVQMFRVGRHVYATQFHPELDLHGLAVRIETYAGFGYFSPHESDDLKTRARGARVDDAHRLLANFVARFATG